MVSCIMVSKVGLVSASWFRGRGRGMIPLSITNYSKDKYNMHACRVGIAYHHYASSYISLHQYHIEEFASIMTVFTVYDV